MKKHQLFLLSVLLFHSCKNAEVRVVILPQQVLLEPIVHEFTTEMFPNSLFIIDNKIITYEAKPINFFFNVFDLNTNQLLYSFGSKGRANNEFIQIDRIIQDGNRFEINNSGSNHLKIFIVEDSCAILEKIISTDNFEFRMRNTYNPCKLNDSIYLLGNNNWETSRHQFVWYNINNDQETTFGALEENFADFLGYFGRIILNKKEEKIAIFYNNAPQYKIINFEGKTLSQCVIKGSISNSETIATAKNPERRGILPDVDNIYFDKIQTTDKYIFAEYYNCKMMDVFKKKGTNLLILNWNGNVIANLLTKERFTSYTISKDGTVYASIAGKPSVIWEFSKI